MLDQRVGNLGRERRIVDVRVALNDSHTARQLGFERIDERCVRSAVPECLSLGRVGIEPLSRDHEGARAAVAVEPAGDFSCYRDLFVSGQPNVRNLRAVGDVFTVLVLRGNCVRRAVDENGDGAGTDHLR